MGSQIPATALGIVEINSYVRGNHEYKESWTPVIGDVLPLQREPSNCNDKLAVAVISAATIVGHVPYNLAPTVSHFLQRSFNKGLTEVTGDRVNRGAGYGLEVPCVYRLYGPKPYTDKLGAGSSDLYPHERTTLTACTVHSYSVITFLNIEEER